MQPLYYGQIRPTNCRSLRHHYGHEPPWPMDRAPHVSLVQAVLSGQDPKFTPYFEYLTRGHGYPASAVLAKQVDVVQKLLEAPAHTIPVEVDSVCDGNHRSAVCVVTGKPITVTPVVPYQTVEFPDRVIAGRRFGARTVDYDFHGKRVLDLGCNAGMMSIYALQHGADHVFAVDRDLRSTTWQLRDAWGFQDKMSVDVAEIETWAAPAVDVVMAFSVVAHIDPEAFAKLVAGRDCILETHRSGWPLPSTGHRWTKIGSSPYRREQPDPALDREIYLGRP